MTTGRQRAYREEYLRSAHWAEVKARYRASDRPQRCVECDDPIVDLHHLTYERLGCEQLTDLVPLCREHHEALHALERADRQKERRDKQREAKKARRAQKQQATKKQLAWIRRLGGSPSNGLTKKQAVRMASRLQRELTRQGGRSPPAS